MVAELEKFQMIDADFKERILERERKQSTVFGGVLPFPIRLIKAIQKTILMFGKLEEPYQKGDELIEFIFWLRFLLKLKPRWKVNY